MFDFSQFPAVYTANQIRALDKYAVEVEGIAGRILMQRAARAAWVVLRQCWPDVERIQVVCGTGNNGGDGYLLAACAREHNIAVCVLEVGEREGICGDAAQARERALAAGVPLLPWSDDCLSVREAGNACTNVIVDALLGIGLANEVRPQQRAVIDAVNAAKLPVLALDIPSGLCADSGQPLGAAVRAQQTVTFIAAKRGLYTGEGPFFCGQLKLACLGVPAITYTSIEPVSVRLLRLADLLAALPARAITAHKGHCGRVLVVGGERGMGGAVLLAAEAALRCGAGLISVATRAEHLSPLLARTPEVMGHGIRCADDVSPLLQNNNVIAIGPGLGQSSWSQWLFQQVCRSDAQLVVDADALNLLARGVGAVRGPCSRWVLTPHPGEAARLLACSVADIEKDRFAAVERLQQLYGGVVLLKGRGTLISDGEQILLCNYGNPGMASGGMGDVLSGVIAALLAQGLPPLYATALAACLHGGAADRAARQGQRGLAASDLMPYLREMLA
ncbi:MAG: NAD(P)H-hydrate dehydratase [Parahaliea sp.]